MTFILNEYEIDDAERLAAEDFHRPNLQRAVLTLARLRDWTNANSDGWAYWRKPHTAATRLQNLVHSRYFGRWDEQPDTDLTTAELKAAYTPIRAFLTRQGVDRVTVFPND
jgi:hypothetical protein